MRAVAALEARLAPSQVKPAAVRSVTPYFLTSTPGVLKTEQNTATIGLVWWTGRKEGAW